MNKKFLQVTAIAAGLLPLASVFAQAQTSDITSTTYYSNNNNNNNFLYSASLGAIPRYGLLWSHSFVGLNVRPATDNNSWILSTDNSNNGGAMMVGGINGSLTFFTIPTANASGPQTLSHDQVYNNRRMQISADGKVVIGQRAPTNQGEYKLAVEGKLVAQSMYITNPNSWADYVFAPNYKVMPLPELETYLRTNKHLPYIPSAKEVEAKGYNVAEMDANLLRTVEELTLQVIELRKQVEQLKAVKANN